MADDQPQLELTAPEEEYQKMMSGLSIDRAGNRILVGLTVEESIWLVDRNRRFASERLFGSTASTTRDPVDRKRHHELREKHERARRDVLMAEHYRNVEKPNIN